jgi:hypothetical protein
MCLKKYIKCTKYSRRLKSDSCQRGRPPYFRLRETSQQPCLHFLLPARISIFFPHLRNGARVHSRVTDTGYYMNTEYIAHRPGFSQTQRFGNWNVSVIRNKGVELGWNVPTQLGPTVRGTLSLAHFHPMTETDLVFEPLFQGNKGNVYDEHNTGHDYCNT